MIIYSLRSKSLEHLNLPFYANNDKEALAMIRDSVLSKRDASLCANIDDLELVRLGRFDNTTGIHDNEFSVVPFDLSNFRKEVK